MAKAKKKPASKKIKKSRSKKKSSGLSETQRFLKVVHDLRTKCPWDKKQTHTTLQRYMLEEAYEAANAIEEKDMDSLREELGDVLLQIALHSEIASEKGHFTFEEVAQGIADKMIHRHPHVYKKTKVLTESEHLKNWNRLKQEEKPKRYLLEGIPVVLPALQLSQRYGEMASSVSFDWKTPDQVFEKVKEELGEFEAELERTNPDKEKMAMELGDLLFTLANLARHLDLDAEVSLRKSAQKFASRFTKMEERKRREGKKLDECSLDELESAWNEIKKL